MDNIQVRIVLIVAFGFLVLTAQYCSALSPWSAKQAGTSGLPGSAPRPGGGGAGRAGRDFPPARGLAKVQKVGAALSF